MDNTNRALIHAGTGFASAGPAAGSAAAPLGGAAASRVAYLACALLLGACDGPADPSPGPPYLAVLANIAAADGVDVGTTYRYHIRELSGTFPVDTVVQASPTDTVILSVPPATYAVTLEGLPAKCTSRYGPDQTLYIPEGTNTGVIRYFVVCSPLLRVITTIEGPDRDAEYIYRLVGAGGERLGALGAADTLLLEGLAPGAYELELSNVAPNCAALSPGGLRPAFIVPETGGTDLHIRIACSNPAARPAIVEFHSTYRGGMTAAVLSVVDPDHDLEQYIWEVTDCHANPVLPAARRARKGFYGTRAMVDDTVRIAAVFDVLAPDSDLVGRCAAVRVVDVNGNTTPIVEVPLRASDTPPVRAQSFDAHITAEPALVVSLALEPSDAWFGIFATIRLRDGVLGEPDGNQDIGIYNTIGYLSTALPPVVLGTRIQSYDVYASEVYLLDRYANQLLLKDEVLRD